MSEEKAVRYFCGYWSGNENVTLFPYATSTVPVTGNNADIKRGDCNSPKEWVVTSNSVNYIGELTPIRVLVSYVFTAKQKGGLFDRRWNVAINGVADPSSAVVAKVSNDLAVSMCQQLCTINAGDTIQLAVTNDLSIAGTLVTDLTLNIHQVRG